MELSRDQRGIREAGAGEAVFVSEGGGNGRAL